MAEPIDLARYAMTRSSRPSTGVNEASQGFVARVKDQQSFAEAKRVAGGTMGDYSRMYGSEQDSLMGQFFEISRRLGTLLVEAKELLASDDRFGADDRLILAKYAATELFMTRDLSDSVALVTLKILEVLTSVKVITDGPDRLVAAEIALTRLRMAPLMPFEAASELVEPLEEYAEDIIGYGTLAEALLDE